MPSLSGALQDGAFGDKEIAVKIRGNSHCRNSRFLGGQVGMLIVLCLVKVSWASGRAAGISGYGQGISAFCASALSRRVLLFYPFCKFTKTRKDLKSK